MAEHLSDSEKQQLLQLARQSIELAVNKLPSIRLNLTDYSQIMQEKGASFVTLTRHGDLRGCIGALEPYQPLVQDVCEHAVAAALEDYRFPPVQARELPQIKIEISRLTLPQPLIYESPMDLIGLLKPGADGLILQDGAKRATFLPQVWEKLPDVEEFLNNLCAKMGASPNLWKLKVLRAAIYHVEEFSED